MASGGNGGPERLGYWYNLDELINRVSEFAHTRFGRRTLSIVGAGVLGAIVMYPILTRSEPAPPRADRPPPVLPTVTPDPVTPTRKVKPSTTTATTGTTPVPTTTTPVPPLQTFPPQPFPPQTFPPPTAPPPTAP